MLRSLECRWKFEAVCRVWSRLVSWTETELESESEEIPEQTERVGDGGGCLLPVSASAQSVPKLELATISTSMSWH